MPHPSGASMLRPPGVILREKESGPGRRSIIRIGPAGEAAVRYALRDGGHLPPLRPSGFGGDFRLQEPQSYGSNRGQSISISDIKRYKEVYSRLYKTAVGTEVMEKYHDIGTSVNISVLNWLAGTAHQELPSLAAFPEAEKISGEAFARSISSAGSPAPAAP